MRQALLMTLALGATGLAKTGPTYYTPERVAAARENVARYEWAQALRTRIVETGDTIRYYIGPTYTAADTYAAQSDEFIWMLQPSTTIPRVAFPRDGLARCPVHGDEVKQVSVWNPWRIDPVSHPYQVQCPIGKEWYPSNAYHKGDMTTGPFADDGSGCLHEGIRYFFIREYAHMAYGSVVVPTLRSLSQAYQLTGDANYARKGCILLARLATQYPNYGWDDTDGALEDRFERTYLGPWDNRHPHYTWKQGGMITDLIWETFCLEATAYAYDGLWDYMDKDPDMLRFLREKGMPVDTADDLREYIETYIFKAAMRALQEGWIHGNEGFHQAAALAVALVLNDYGEQHPNSQDMVEYVYRGKGRAVGLMRNGILPDGGGHESPNYNKIKLDFIRVSRLMECIRERQPDRFPQAEYPDLFGDPKTRALFDFYIDIVVADSLYPSIGDCGGLRTMERRRVSMVSALDQENVFAVKRFRDPRFARACLDEQGALCTGELWEPFPEELIRTLAAQPGAEPVRESRLLDHYGTAILESGDVDRRRSLVLNYSSLFGHRQRDQLNLELHARGLYLLQDLGYPKTWEYRDQWDANSMAHNTVTIDETPVHVRSSGGRARLTASVDGVHVITASHDAYRTAKLPAPEAPRVTLYERTSLLIDVDPDRFYVVDLFLVNGGEQHDQSWHAFRGPVTMPELPWQVQDAGTLAGRDVPQFAAYTDRWGRKHPKGDFASFLGDIQRAELASPASWEWNSGLPEGDALRLHLLPLDGPAEVIMGKGRSPVRDALDYVLVRRRPEAGGVSRFLSVLDAYQGEPVVHGVRVDEGPPVALEVTLADQTHRILLDVPATHSNTTAHRPIRVRVARQALDGAVLGDVRIGWQSEDGSEGYASGIVEAIAQPDSNAPIITLARKADGDPQDFAVGRWIRVFSDERSAMYRIREAESVDGRTLRLTLDRTTLLAQGRVAELSGQTLKLDTHLLFARRLAGAYVSVDDHPVGKIRSAQQDGTLVLVEGSGPKEALETAPGDTARLWQMAVGDRVEAPRIESARP